MSYYGRPFAVKSKKPTEMVNTLDAVAATVMAYHANGDKIEKHDSSGYPATEFFPASLPVVSNKTRALAFLSAPDSITQAAKDEAQEIIQFIQGQMTMSMLSGTKVSDFVRDLAITLEEESVPKFKVGLLCYAPNTYVMGKKKEAIVEETVAHLYTSQPLGAVGMKVTVNFTLLDKRYIQSFDCFACYGTDDKGNLISFLTKHEDRCVSGTYSGKIKKCENDAWHNNAMVTSLNYVKLVA